MGVVNILEEEGWNGLPSKISGWYPSLDAADMSTTLVLSFPLFYGASQYAQNATFYSGCKHTQGATNSNQVKVKGHQHKVLYNENAAGLPGTTLSFLSKF